MKNQETILIVDDEKVVCESCVRILSKEGFDVETSTNPAKALKMAKTKKCGRRTYASAIKLTDDTWKCSTKTNKEKLLKALKLNKSWARTKTIKEMVDRGGGLPAKELLNLKMVTKYRVRIFLARYYSKKEIS